MSGAFGLSHQVERVTGKFKLPQSYIESESKEYTKPNGDTFTRSTNKIVHGEREVTEGYMVYFPRGHSIFVAMDDTDTIKRLQLDQGEVPLVDYSGEGGIIQGNGTVRTPKQAVAASLARRGGRQGGLTELVGGTE